MIHKSVFFCLFFWSARGVFGDSDEVKSVSVMEGHSVTLHTDLTHIQTHDQILWMFGPQETRIAEIYMPYKAIDMFDSKKIFGNRLKLDSQTGSLTITNINIINSGLYQLQIRSDRGNSDKTFNVTAYARLSVPVISRNSSHCSSSSSERSSCVFVCSVLNVPHVTLSWYNGSDLHSSISVSDLNIRLSLPLEVEYQDTNTYSCVLNNPITNHTTHLNITQLCQPCSESKDIGLGLGIAVLVILLVVVVVSAVKYFHWKKKSRPTTNEESR